MARQKRPNILPGIDLELTGLYDSAMEFGPLHPNLRALLVEQSVRDGIPLIEIAEAIGTTGDNLGKLIGRSSRHSQYLAPLDEWLLAKSLGGGNGGRRWEFKWVDVELDPSGNFRWSGKVWEESSTPGYVEKPSGGFSRVVLSALPAHDASDSSTPVLLQEMIELIDKFTALVRKDVVPAAERLDFLEANLRSLLDLVPSVRAVILQGQDKKD